MIIDKLMSPAIGVALSGFTVSTQTVGTVLDLGADRNQGLIVNGYGPGWVVTIKDATSGGAATLTLSLITSAASNLGTPTTLWTGTALALATLADDGTQFFVGVPDSDDWLRYAAFRATVGTAVYTAGTISIEYVADARRWRAYPAETGR